MGEVEGLPFNQGLGIKWSQNLFKLMTMALSSSNLFNKRRSCAFNYVKRGTWIVRVNRPT